MSSRPDCPWCDQPIRMGGCGCGFNGPKDWSGPKKEKEKK